jgi:hypothetical protein
MQEPNAFCIFPFVSLLKLLLIQFGCYFRERKLMSPITSPIDGIASTESREHRIYSGNCEE